MLDAPARMELMPGGAEINLGSIFGEMLPKKKKRRKMTVKQAMQQLIAEESEKLIDNDSVNTEALRRAEEQGIIFIDEIDKIAGKEKPRRRGRLARGGPAGHPAPSSRAARS